MSEASNVWRVDVGGQEHEIELTHTMGDKHTVKLDGTVLEEKRNWSFKGAEIIFDISGHPAVIKIERTYGGMGNRSNLHVDERYVEPLQR